MANCESVEAVGIEPTGPKVGSPDQHQAAPTPTYPDGSGRKAPVAGCAIQRRPVGRGVSAFAGRLTPSIALEPRFRRQSGDSGKGWGRKTESFQGLSGDKGMAINTPPKDSDEKRFNETLKRMLKTPPKPHVVPDGDAYAHWSSCAVNNGPALPAGPCDCGGFRADKQIAS